MTVLVALLVCLIPTTIGGLLSAIGIAGMDRLIRRNVIALSGRAVEAAGDVDVLLLDKTGTITLGNRQAVEFIPVGGIAPRELAEAAQLASLADETPEGRSIVVLAKEKYGLRGRTVGARAERGPACGGPDGAYGQTRMRFVPFTAQTRMSGVDLDGLRIRKGAPDAMMALIECEGTAAPADLRGSCRADRPQRRHAAGRGRNGQALGVIHSRTSSRAASRSASPSCAGWASRR